MEIRKGRMVPSVTAVSARSEQMCGVDWEIKGEQRCGLVVVWSPHDSLIS
jgi:hypothetical protein